MNRLPWESLPTLVLKAQEERLNTSCIGVSPMVRAAIKLTGMAVALAVSIDFSWLDILLP